jgi:ABC-type transport system involved in cytochrome bd biosynthesis fused ATPase/permease subunit
MKKPDLTFLHSELVRVSEWVQFADKKAAFLGAFYTAIFGFLVTQREDILWKLYMSQGLCGALFALTLIALLVCLAVGLAYLFRSVLPRLRNNNTDHSLFYFGNVAKKKIADYLQEIDELTEDRATKEVAEQIHTNSCIAQEKMGNVKQSTRFLFASVVSFALLLVLLW